jgi:hypothetical protein
LRLAVAAAAAVECRGGDAPVKHSSLAQHGNMTALVDDRELDPAKMLARLATARQPESERLPA